MSADCSAYFFDPHWLRPVYTRLFLLISLGVATLVVGIVGYWAWKRRRGGRGAEVRAILAALVTLVAIEAALTGLSVGLPLHATYVNLGEFWTLKPSDRPTAKGASRTRVDPGKAWAPRPESSPRIDWQPVGTHHLQSARVDDLGTLRLLLPNLRGVRPEWARVPMEVTSNSLGLREREIPLEKDPGEYRIVCLGDSWTFGFGVRVEEAFPRVLEAHLGKKFPRRNVTVINAGMSGAEYSQGYVMLCQIALQYHPDLVICCGYRGDVAMPSLDVPFDPSPVDRLLDHSTLYRVLRQGVLTLSGAPPAVKPMNRGDYVLKMARVLSDRGIDGIFFDHVGKRRGSRRLPDDVTWMSALPEIDPADGRNYQRPVMALPGQVAIALYSKMYTKSDHPFMLATDPNHPSAVGHAEMGRMLAEFITCMGYVDPPPSR